MTEQQRPDFGVKVSALHKAASRMAIVGTVMTKAAKVSALASILMGAPTEDTSKRTGIAESTLKRIAAVARGKDASKVSKRLHAIDWAALVNDESPDHYDAALAASLVWDDHLAESGKSSKTSKSKLPESASDLAILIHDTIVSRATPESLDAWIDAVNDAIASATATLAESAEVPAAA